MAVKLPNGATISVANTYGAAKAFTVITNVAEAVVTLPALHGVVVGDVVEITSGWSKLSGQIARVKTVATNDVTLEGIDTSDETRFPVGAGGGSVRVVTAMTQLTQVTGIETSGGDQQFATYAFLEDDTERQIPTNKSAQSYKITLADDPSLPWYSVLAAADAARTARAVKVLLPSGSVILFNGYVTLNKTPTMTLNNVMAITSTVSLVAPQTRYAS